MIKTDMHLHSSFSDGKNTPEEIVLEAIRLRYSTIAITDHVRRTTNWLEALCEEISRLKRLFSSRITIYSGIEVKVTNLRGDVDACPDFFDKVDVTLGAFHRIPIGEDEYMSHDEIKRNKNTALSNWFTSMMYLLENDRVTIIAHPTAILKRNHIDVPYEMKSDIARKAAQHGKTFEINIRYQVPDEEFLDLLKGYKVMMTFGSDSHSIEEMRALATSEWGSSVQWRYL